MKLRSLEAISIFSLLEQINLLKTQLNKALQPLQLEVQSVSEVNSKEGGS